MKHCNIMLREAHKRFAVCTATLRWQKIVEQFATVLAIIKFVVKLIRSASALSIIKYGDKTFCATLSNGTICVEKNKSKIPMLCRIGIFSIWQKLGQKTKYFGASVGACAEFTSSHQTYQDGQSILQKRGIFYKQLWVVPAIKSQYLVAIIDTGSSLGVIGDSICCKIFKKLLQVLAVQCKVTQKQRQKLVIIEVNIKTKALCSHLEYLSVAFWWRITCVQTTVLKAVLANVYQWNQSGKNV